MSPEITAPKGLDPDAARAWRLAGGLVLGVPVADVGDGQRLPHGGSDKSTGYGPNGVVLTSGSTTLRDAG